MIWIRIGAGVCATTPLEHGFPQGDKPASDVGFDGAQGQTGLVSDLFVTETLTNRQADDALLLGAQRAEELGGQAGILR